MMCIHDMDERDASRFLRDCFTEIDKTDIPSSYKMFESKEKYMLMLGDPIFPKHFAVVVDMESEKSYFSKLTYFGSGFDSLNELKSEFSCEGEIYDEDIHYYKFLGNL